ncbi:MAG: hypothetical protein WCG52_08715 [bacterium]
MRHPLLQKIYNYWRTTRYVAQIANFFISRENAFRTWEKNCIDKCIMASGCKRVDETYILKGSLFSEMLWPNAYALGSEFAPKVLGTYEMEIAPIINNWMAKYPITSIINIGASEGHYAVGLARRLPGIPVYAYEIQEVAHPKIAALATLNNVGEQIKVKSEFSNGELLLNKFGALPFFLIDIDGGEDSLCDEVFARNTKHCLLLIEIHDCYISGIGKRLLHRFASTHALSVIRYSPNARRKAIRPKGISQSEWMRATDERRPATGNYWIVMVPKNHYSV